MKLDVVDVLAELGLVGYWHFFNIFFLLVVVVVVVLSIVVVVVSGFLDFGLFLEIQVVDQAETRTAPGEVRDVP